MDNDHSLYLKKLNTTNVKKFYLGMEFNKINNEEYYNKELYSLNLTMSYKRAPIYTSQINHISMQMPSTPVLYQWDKIPKVILC